MIYLRKSFFPLPIWKDILGARQYVLRHKVSVLIGLAVVLVVIGIVLAFFFPDSCFIKSLFGKERTISPSEIITYFGVAAGGIILLGQLWGTDLRIKIQAQGNLDTRFKDASLLLAEKNTSAILAGVYALHQVAVEAKQDPRTEGYVTVVKNILCSYLRENNKVVEKEKDGRKTVTWEKPELEIVFQTIVDVLFLRSDSTVYTGMDFSGIVLRNLNLTHINLSKAYLFGANLSGADLWSANLSRADLWTANLSGADLREVNLSGAKLSFANLSGADLFKAKLSRADLNGANLGFSYLREADLSGANLSRANLNGAELPYTNLNFASLEYTDLSNAVFSVITDFTNTIHAGKTVDEIRAYVPPEIMD